MPKQPPCPRRMRGFTLVEVLVVVAMIALLMVGAGVGLGGTLARHRVAGAGGELVASLTHARTVALARGAAASMCPSADASRCGGAWDRGWIVFVDRDRDGARDDAEPLLAATQPSLAGLTITTTSTRTRVQFLPDGRAAGSTITFQVCSSDPPVGERVIVSNVGRVRREAGGACAP